MNEMQDKEYQATRVMFAKPAESVIQGLHWILRRILRILTSQFRLKNASPAAI